MICQNFICREFFSPLTNWFLLFDIILQLALYPILPELLYIPHKERDNLFKELLVRFVNTEDRSELIATTDINDFFLRKTLHLHWLEIIYVLEVSFLSCLPVTPQIKIRIQIYRSHVIISTLNLNKLWGNPSHTDWRYLFWGDIILLSGWKIC